MEMINEDKFRSHNIKRVASYKISSFVDSLKLHLSNTSRGTMNASLKPTLILYLAKCPIKDDSAETPNRISADRMPPVCLIKVFFLFTGYLL